MSKQALATRVHTELQHALHSSITLTALREAVMHVVCSLDPAPESAPATVDQSAPTLRSGPPSDCAPNVPATSEEIREYDRAEASSRREVAS